MSLKTENSRRVAKSHPVCMGLYTLTIVLVLVTHIGYSLYFYKGNNLIYTTKFTQPYTSTTNIPNVCSRANWHLLIVGNNFRVSVRAKKTCRLVMNFVFPKVTKRKLVLTCQTSLLNALGEIFNSLKLCRF
jgi:hypothetical protein